MSAATFPMYAVRAEPAAEESVDAGLAEAARRLLAGGPVSFKLSVIVDTARMPPARRAVYGFLRRLPRRLYVPPAPAAQKGVYDAWADAVCACRTPRHQLLAMPRNREYDDGTEDVAVECRPRDESDGLRTRTLASVFGPARPPDPLVRVEGRLDSIERRLAALERERCV